MKIVDSPECPLYNNTPETIELAFLERQKIHTLWRQVEFWLGMVLKDKIKFSDSEKILCTAYKKSILLTKRKYTKTDKKVRCLISQKSNMNYQRSYNMNSIMPKLRGNFQYLNKRFLHKLKKSMAGFFQEFSKVTSNICYQHKMG